MLRRDFARTTDSIGATDFYKMAMDFHDRQKQKELDANEIMSGYQKGVNMQRQNALADALQSGDEEAINKAAAAYDPQGQLDYIQRIKQARADADLEFQRQKELADYNHALDMKKQDALYNLKNNLEAIKGGYGTAAMQNMKHLESLGFSPTDAALLVNGAAQNPAYGQISPSLGKKGFEAYDKKIGEDLADQQIAQRQMRTLEPRAKAAIARAKDSLQEGTGLGQIGGRGWTTGQGGINRANVKNAQAQINTSMRGLLKEMGVGSTEMNSALEAEAYRYNIDPTSPIPQQEQVLKNFEDDYLSGKLANELGSIYSKKQQQTPIPRSKTGLANISDDELLGSIL